MMIDHIGLYVEDLEKAKMFFIKYFHAVNNTKYHNQNTGLQTYFLSFKDGTRLEIMQRPETKTKTYDKNKDGYHHLAFRCANKEEVDALTKRLLEDGYQILSGPRVTGDGYYETLFLYEQYAIELIYK
jgi:lactoylglutathione lyase